MFLEIHILNGDVRQKLLTNDCFRSRDKSFIISHLVQDLEKTVLTLQGSY
jgi:hypothetical protein